MLPWLPECPEDTPTVEEQRQSSFAVVIGSVSRHLSLAPQFLIQPY